MAAHPEARLPLSGLSFDFERVRARDIYVHVRTGASARTPAVTPSSGPLPLPPRRATLGRDRLVAETAANLLADSPRPTLVLGAPGIGKTNLTLAALHDARVAARFRARRYFVRCEGATSAPGVISELARAMDVPLVGDPLAACLARLAEAPSAVCLDNAETPCEADTLRCEELLDHLAAASALLVSVRGSERPGGPSWAPPLRLEPLGDADARALFLSIAGKNFEHPSLAPLLADMGGVPLAVELLAHAAEGESSIESLAQRWRSERVGLLERGPADHRLLSVAVSIEVSWYSDLMTDPARRLLSLLGRLPDGIAHADLPTLLPDEGPKAANVLRRRGLAFDEDERLRVLPPLRHHVEMAYPPSDADWARTTAHFCRLASELGWTVGHTGGNDAARRLVTESGNLTAALLAGLRADDPGPALEAIIGVAESTRFTGADHGQLLKAGLEAVRNRRDDRQLATFLVSWGNVANDLSDRAGARAAYEEALSVVRQFGDTLAQAHCLRRLGNVAQEGSEYAEAMRRYAEALSLYRLIGHAGGQANCTRRLGHIALERADYDTATGYYEEALALFRSVSDSLGEANCIRSLGTIACESGDLASASERYLTARALFQLGGTLRGEADCILGLGNVALRGGDLDAANARYSEALSLYRQVGSVRGEAECGQCLGDVERQLLNYGAARVRYEEALALYELYSQPYRVGMVHRDLARLAVIESDTVARRDHVDAARAAWVGIGRQDLIADMDREFPEVS